MIILTIETSCDETGIAIYDAKKGGFTELSMLDVMQIFGRAGRPQFDTSGEVLHFISGVLNCTLSLMF